MTDRNREQDPEADTKADAGSRENAEGIPIVEPAGIGPPDGERNGPVLAVVLAAGTSSRFGEANKLLATVAGRPLVRQAVDSLRASAVDRVLVVLGHEASRARGALCGLDGLDEPDIEFVINDEYEAGQATSVRAGVRVARERGARAVVIALGDMPAVDSRTTDALVAAYRAGVGDALAAAHENRRGNPVLFGEQYFDALCEVSGDTGGRRILLESDGARLVETGDPGVLRDVDTRSDLDRVE